MLFFVLFFFFNDTATTEIYTLSLHDALPILRIGSADDAVTVPVRPPKVDEHRAPDWRPLSTSPPEPEKGGRGRSEEHTSELQSRQYLVCRLLLEKKKKNKFFTYNSHKYIIPP